MLARASKKTRRTGTTAAREARTAAPAGGSASARRAREAPVVPEILLTEKPEPSAQTPLKRSEVRRLVGLLRRASAMLCAPLAPADLEEVGGWARIITAWLEAIGRGIFVVHLPPTPEQHEELLKTIHPMQGPTPSQLREIEAYRRGEPSQRGEIGAYLAKAEKKERREELKALEHYTRKLAKSGMQPKDISAELVERYGFSETSASETATNSRLYRARTAGFKQPKSPTSKRPRTKTK